MADNATKRLAVLGGGKMGRALVEGMIAKNVFSPRDISVGEPNEAARRWWQQHVPGVNVDETNAAVVADADLVLLAVKPALVAQVANDVQRELREKLVISIAAGVCLESLQEACATPRVVRVMPNTPCLVGTGVCGYCCGRDVSEADEQDVVRILSSVGIVTKVEERLMDAVTGLSGSGPAYVYLFIEALADAGVAEGLPREVAVQLAAQTVAGAAKMVLESELHPGVLKDQVTSPGGTTIAGLTALEQNAFRGTTMRAVAAATARSRQLGG